MTNINQSKIKKATKVFNEVFNKYDVMNDIMSFGIHRLWKKRLIDWMNPSKGDYLVDIASGENCFLDIIIFLDLVSVCHYKGQFLNQHGAKV